MRKLCRAALLPILAFLSIQAATLIVPRVYAGAVPAAASPAKKKNKYKNKYKKPKFKKAKYKATKQNILKGHHGKHKGKPA